MAGSRADPTYPLMLYSALWRAGPVPHLGTRSELALNVGLVGKPAPSVCVACVLGSNCGSAFSVSFLSGVQMPLQLGWKHEENSRTGTL